MKRFLIPLAFFILHSAFCIKVFAQPLDSAYHDNAEILSELRYYADMYPDFVALDSIGHSAQYNMPIWCAKLSDHPHTIEPRAAILLVGQVHAEETVGIEIVLEIMKQMLENNDLNAMRQRLQGLEIYIIPTANPEGLDVVTSGRDVAYRKNCRDNVGDGQLRIQDGEGWDTSGIDLNRNFGTHWDRGDTLYRPEAVGRYNGYRGAAPFSEPESQALRDLALSRPFLYSIVYHSSRSGANNELVIAPWYWSPDNVTYKRPPDYLAINCLEYRLATLIPKYLAPDEHFWPGQSTQRKGQLQDWFYAETGCLQYMIEVSSVGVHPELDTMRQIVSNNLPAMWHLMDLALGLAGLDSMGTVTVLASDATTHRPLEANIVVHDLDNPILTPRHTNALNGRFDWLLYEGDHDITIKKLGYRTRDYPNYQIIAGERVVLNVALDPLSPASITFRTRDVATGGLTRSRLMLKDSDGHPAFDLDLADGILTLDLPQHPYQATLTSTGYVPQSFPLEISRPAEFEFTLQHEDTTFVENFDSDRGWERSGDDWGITSFDGRSCLTESVSGDYPNDADLYLQLDSIATLDTMKATLRIVHLPYCEPPDDYQEISWWTNPDSVHTKRYSQLRASRQPSEVDGGGDVPDWDTLYVSLDSLEPGPLNVKFHEVTDHIVQEDGWLIDQVSVFKAGVINSVPVVPLTPYTLHLAPCYPNPFNSTTSISFTLPKAGWTKVDVLDISGRLVERLANGRLEAGEHRVVWNAGNLGSGVYLVRLQYAGENTTTKALLIR